MIGLASFLGHPVHQTPKLRKTYTKWASIYRPTK